MTPPHIFSSLALAIALAALSPAQTTWYVDQSGAGDFLTIQAGVDGASNGDTVIVRDGTYPEFVLMNGRAITLTSENGPQFTSITGISPSGYTVHIQNGEGPSTIVEGFRLSNGAGQSGLFIKYSSPQVIGLEISGYQGRGVWVEEASPFLLSCSISGNGGGVYSTQSDLSISECTISSNSLSSSGQHSGGGISSTDGQLHLQSTTLNQNSAHSTGGALFINGSETWIEDCTFFDNDANSTGGAIYSTTSLTITGSTFDSNHILPSGTGSGGAIYCSQNVIVTISSSIFHNNSSGHEGGALHLKNGVISTSTFTNNHLTSTSGSVTKGGAIHAARLQATECDFLGNGSSDLAYNTYGSALYLDSESPQEVFEITDCNFEGNLSEGGTVYVLDYEAEFTDCVFNSNEAWTSGGAINALSNITVNNSLVFGTIDHSGGNGGPMGGWGSFEMNSCTVADNQGFAHSLSDVQASNCIVWGNNQFPLAILSATYSCIEGGFPGVGNTPYSPNFTNGPAGGYYLSQVSSGQLSDSSCLDAGDPSGVILHGTTRTDEAPDLGRLDIGFHYSIDPPPPPTDSDADGLSDEIELNVTLTDPFDDDTDDDGLGDGEEYLYGNPQTDPALFDTDGDSLGDGLEMGRGHIWFSGTDPLIFIPDADPSTTTSPVSRDSDSGGVWDSVEDANQNGKREFLETDPTAGNGDDDIVTGSIQTSVPQVSMSTGGIAELRLDFASKYGQERFMILGSLAGQASGFQLGRVQIPIDFDGLTSTLLMGAYYPQMVNFDNYLDNEGDGLAFVVMAPNSPASFAGLSIYWSAIVMHSNGYPLTTSDVVILQFVP